MKPLTCNTTTPSTTSRLLSIAAAVCFVLSLSLSLSLLHRESSSHENVQFNATTDNSTEQCTCDSSIININSTNTNIPPLVSSPPSSSIAATFDLHGDVSDCCCSFAAIERANIDKVHPLLQRIVSTPFFAHFKIDLCSDCELWEDAPTCMLRDCGVCECESPPAWADAVDWMPMMTTADDNGVVDDDDDDCGGGQHDAVRVDDRVVPMVDSHVSESWTASSVPFFFDESSEERQQSTSIRDDDTAVVVDLRLNPERYTGYSGQSAEKVWTSIHRDNCFQQNEDGDDDDASDAGYCNLPGEQRLYNRIISGMHSSISLHIAHSYCLEMDPERIAECKTWGRNATLAHDRVLRRKDRLENLYVAFAVMLRAVRKAGPSIAAAVPAGDPYYADSISEWTERLQPEITKMAESCPPTFDETSLFSEMGGGDDDDDDDDDVESKRLELNRRFRHLMEIMRCVGCDRCKLWGTLQTLGVGTALRIILEEDEESSSRDGIDLSRQEAVALVHTLERFSSALVYIRDFQEV